MGYRVRLSKSALADLRSVANKKRLRQITKRLDGLQSDPRPRGCKKLGDEVYRIRSGDFRIVYHVRDQDVTVLVLRIGDRKDIYRDLALSTDAIAQQTLAEEGK